MIEENCREVRNDLVGLNIWWNLNILRDTVKGGGQSGRLLQKAHLLRCASALAAHARLTGTSRNQKYDSCFMTFTLRFVSSFLAPYLWGSALSD